MSIAQNELISSWNGLPGRTEHARVLAAGQKVFRGSLAMLFNGKVYSAQQLSTAPMNALILNVPGADVNGGVRLWASQANVTYRQFGGISQTLKVSVNFLPSTVEIFAQMGTDGAGVVTSTAKEIVTAIQSNSIASKYVHAYFTGTGNGLGLVAVPAAVPMVHLLGVAEETYDNAAGITDLVLGMRFRKGILNLAGFQSDFPTSAMIGSSVSIVDNTTVKATVNALDLTVKLADIDDTFVYCDLDRE